MYDHLWLWIFLVALVPLTEAFGRRLRLPLWLRISVMAALAFIIIGVLMAGRP